MSSPSSSICTIETAPSSVQSAIDLESDLNVKRSTFPGLTVSASSCSAMFRDDSITEAGAGNDNAWTLEERSITHDSGVFVSVALAFIASEKKDLKILGFGNFGIVYKVNAEPGAEFFALKTLRDDIAQSVDGMAYFINEINCMKAMNHQNIIKCLCSFEFDHDVAMIMPMARMSLSSFINSRRTPCSDNVLKKLVIQVGRGIKYIHSLGWVHRDLKPDNVLCVNEVWKIADMGLITHRDTCLLEGRVGTVNYWAPELLMGEANSKASDCWALGIVFTNAILSPFLKVFYGDSVDTNKAKEMHKNDYLALEDKIHSATMIIRSGHCCNKVERSLSYQINKYCGGFRTVFGEDGHPIPSIVRKLPNYRERLLVQLFSLLKDSPVSRMPIGYFINLVQREYL